MPEYNPKKIEAKWQKFWDKTKPYKAEDKSDKPKCYSLVEFPYPSGEGLHTGHVRSYTALDIISRKRRMEGFNVLYPIGWDAFGLPAENYAIKTGINPAITTKKNIENYRKQLKSLGILFDWTREVNTTDPEYYKWTQWLFLKFLEHGLAYKAKQLINWCPKDKIGLANEEVVDGCCERCGTPVEKREKEQWMLAITKYAERLDKDLDTVDFPERVKAQQRNWIGRREGAEIEFLYVPSLTLPEGKGGYGYHTGNPEVWKKLQDRAVEMREHPTEAEERLWKVLKADLTGFHFRRQHIIDRLIVDFVCLERGLVIEVDGDIHDYQKSEDAERTAFLNKHEFKVIRFKNEEVIGNLEEILKSIRAELNTLPLGKGGGWDASGIKIFTTRPETIFGATFVAIAGEKDKFTGRYVINPATKEKIPVWEAEYVMKDVGTGAIMGVPADDERDNAFALAHNLPIVEYYQKAGFEDFGQKKTTFKLRDWIFSRQRYWGEPIPVILCPTCGVVSVPEKDLPVKLPKVDKYQPTDTGESPLATIDKWVNVKCPKCGGKAKRETDTMPNWAGSSWYFLRYCDPHNKKQFASMEKMKYWMGDARLPRASRGVDWYNGGMEHTTLHLLYSRFWNKFLFDIGLVPTSEPYKKRTSHGLINAADGRKMSKSFGNVVNPDDIVNRFGADTLRVYEMFMGPFEQAIAWNEDSLVGPRRFLERVWKLSTEFSNSRALPSLRGLRRDSNLDNSVLMHQIIKKVSEDIESMGFNTAISSLMIWVNALEKQENVSAEEFEALLKLLNPFAPHITEELWKTLGHKNTLGLEEWPKFDESKITGEEVTIGVQVNGKHRANLTIPSGVSEEDVKTRALALPEVQKWLEGREPKRIIVVLGKIVNIVV